MLRAFDGHTQQEAERLINIYSVPTEIKGQDPSMSRSEAQSGSGWRLGVLLSFLGALAILVFNVTLTIWSIRTYGSREGIGTAFTGSCNVVNRWLLGLKVLINVLGTALLGASNYTSQCLSSPTRKDLDNAHLKGDWMDIGVTGLRNLSRIHWSRKATWCSLIISSIPVHLLYNAIIFKSLDTQIYNVVVATPAFLRGPAHSYGVGVGKNATDITAIEHIQTMFDDDRSTFEHLSVRDCIQAYAQPTISGRSDVILITNSTLDTTSSTVFYFQHVNSFERDHLPYSWICRDAPLAATATTTSFCDASRLAQDASKWTIEGWKIEYCLSRRVEQHCKLQFSIYMMAAVIVCNGVKIICMLLTLFQHKEDIIVTLGDAISSYLRKADPVTAHNCLLEARHVQKSTRGGPSQIALECHPRTPTMPGARWASGVSWTRWILTATIFCGVLIIDASFLTFSASSLASKQGSSAILWSIGFGAVDSRALIRGVLPSHGLSNLVPAVLLANLPQILLSLAYVAYNGLFTSMLLAKEWQSFSMYRQPLRVSKPEGSQISTRWLSLPYRYSIPLLASSSIMASLAINRWCLDANLFDSIS